MRTKLSWVIGIAFFFLVMFIATHLANFMELPLDSDLGVIVTLLVGMLSHKIYLLIQQEKPPFKDRLTSNCWIIGLTLSMVLVALIYKAFEHSYSDLGTFFRIALEISAIAGTVWVVKQIYEKKKAQYEARLKQYFEIENNK